MIARILIGFVVLMAVAIIAMHLSKGTYEEPRYKVLASDGPLELRLYEPRLVAEVTLPGGMDDTMNDAFRILAAYIFGENTPQQKIAMTAPVVGTADAAATPKTTIAMTAPVIGAVANESSFSTQFTMPSEYTPDTLPKPKDQRIVIRTIPAQKVVAMRFSWLVSSLKIMEGTRMALAFAEKNNLKQAGQPHIAFYDNPYSTLPWQRRNEVLLPVTSSKAR